MKTPIDKEKLTYLSTEIYKTQNPYIKVSYIARYLYDGAGLRYQPQIENTDGKVLIDNCCYTQKDEAKKAIDNYIIINK